MTTSGLYVPGARDWVDVRELAERLRNGRDKVTLALNGATDPDVWERWRQLRDSHFYIVRNRNGGTGERYMCARCSGYVVERGMKIPQPIYHEFFTLCCVSQPFRGLEEALWAYTSLANDEITAQRMVTWIPTIGTAHPQSFGRLASSEPEEEVIAVAIGTLEPISEAKARQLAAHINSRRPPKPFVL